LPSAPDSLDAAPPPDAAVALRALPRLDAGALPGRVVLPCRALAVTGHPTLEVDGGARPLAVSDLASGWITLGAGDAVTAKLPRSGREVSLVGPGLADPCGAEGEAWVAAGVFRGGRGAGETPGGEEWVVTPSAVVRYGAAIVEVRVEGGRVTANLNGGAASVLSGGIDRQQASDAGGTTWVPLVAAAAPVVVNGVAPSAAANAAAAKRCSDAEADAEAIEAKVLADGGTTAPTFADDARHAGEARLLVRAMCEMAKVQARAVRSTRGTRN
jgi:hypothetical protein